MQDLTLEAVRLFRLIVQAQRDHRAQVVAHADRPTWGGELGGASQHLGEPVARHDPLRRAGRRELVLVEKVVAALVEFYDAGEGAVQPVEGKGQVRIGEALVLGIYVGAASRHLQRPPEQLVELEVLGLELTQEGRPLPEDRRAHGPIVQSGRRSPPAFPASVL